MAFNVLKQKCGASGPDSGGRLSPHMHFRDAVGYFGNLENGIGFGLNALEFTGAVQGGDPLAEVVEGQRVPLCDRRLYGIDGRLHGHGFTRINTDSNYWIWIETIYFLCSR